VGTINGFGTTYYGWKRLDDETAEATTWIVAAFFPVIPLRRCRVRVIPSPGARAIFLVVQAKDSTLRYRKSNVCRCNGAGFCGPISRTSRRAAAASTARRFWFGAVWLFFRFYKPAERRSFS